MISVSVVLYNTQQHQVISILNMTNKEYFDKVYIIDNSPIKQLDENKLPSKKFEYIHNNNSGYGSSHNIAIKKSIEERFIYHLVLNPDISFKDDVIPEIIKYMDHNTDVVYLLPKVKYPDGRIQYLCKLLPNPFDLVFRRFFPKIGIILKRDQKYTLLKSGYNRIINPPCLSGCFMFLRIQEMEQNNIFFDERFFMYCEDFDLIRRLHRIGKTIFYPNVEIIHDHAQSSYKNMKMFIAHIKSGYIYFHKWGWFFDKERRIWNKKILLEIEELDKSL